jgi:hypothetical protein
MTTTVNTYNMSNKGNAITLANELVMIYHGREHMTAVIRDTEYWTGVDFQVATLNGHAWNGVRLSVNEEGTINIFFMKHGAHSGDETRIIGSTSYAVLEATINTYLNKILGSN